MSLSVPSKHAPKLVRRKILYIALFGAGILITATHSVSDGAQKQQTTLQAEATKNTGINGHVYHKSDVSTESDMPYNSGIVLAFYAESWPLLLQQLNIDPAQALRHFNLPRAQYDAVSAMTAQIGTEGGYGLSVVPGQYLLCVGNLGGVSPPRYGKISGSRNRLYKYFRVR